MGVCVSVHVSVHVSSKYEALVPDLIKHTTSRKLNSACQCTVENTLIKLQIDLRMRLDH